MLSHSQILEALNNLHDINTKIKTELELIKKGIEESKDLGLNILEQHLITKI